MVVDPLKNVLALDTLHIHTDELPWVSDGSVTYRLLQARPEDRLVVGHFRTAPGLASPLHRHLGPTMIYTISGTWGHRHDVADHRAGTYVYEPIDAVHRFYGRSAVELIDFSFGGTEVLTDDGEVTGLGTVELKVKRYFELCEEQGVGRPALLN
jgi:quercetin dioxygenase-like cupin family protein